jgi:hypothetical protein
MFEPGVLIAATLFVMERSAESVTVAVLEAVFRGAIPAVFVNIVPVAVPEGMFATTTNWTVLFAGTVPLLQLIRPPEPKEGAEHVKPESGVKERKVSVPGSGSLIVTSVIGAAVTLEMLMV